MKAKAQKLSEIERATVDAEAAVARVQDPALKRIAYSAVLRELLATEYVTDLAAPGDGLGGAPAPGGEPAP